CQMVPIWKTPIPVPDAYPRRDGYVMIPVEDYEKLEALDIDHYRQMLKAWPEYYRLKEEVLQSGNVTMRWAGMERLRARNLQIGSVIDVGAADGESFHELGNYFPDARFLCIEAEAAHEPALASLKEKHPRVDYIIAAAGDKPGK